MRPDSTNNPGPQVFPLVSVIIPFYKQELYLPATIESVLQDGYPNIEIIVVDDGSPVPATSVIVPSAPISVLRTQNGGQSAARNVGFRAGKGEFLLFLDSDDLLVPGAIASHVALLTANRHAALSFGAVSIIDSTGAQCLPPHICRPRKNYFHKLLEGNMIATPGAAVIRRRAFQEAGFFDESLRMVEDYSLYLRIASKNALILNQRHVLRRRMHANNMSADLTPMLEATMGVLDKLEAVETLSTREKRQIAHGRRRWLHEYNRKDDLRYRLKSLYFSLKSMMDVSLLDMLRRRTDRP